MAVRPEPFEGTDPARRASARRREPQGEGHPAAGRGRGEKALLCLTCKRVRPARNPTEYTVLRAYSITMYGLCVCAQTPAWPLDLRALDAWLPDPTTESGGTGEAGP
jgi:hypothetical protein